MSIFVFGSNLQGIHGKGAALVAEKCYGAERGVGRGMTGRAYALPTKSTPNHSLPLSAFRKNVREFIEFARLHPEYDFEMTAVGTGLAGFEMEDLLRAIKDAGGLPRNVKRLWSVKKERKTL